jgi:hypothetical protein
MNATYNNNNNNNNNNKKPFCKVCADAGKTDTAHYVRLTPDPKSPVVCPTLLALECRYCFKSGHTVKYCPLAKKNSKLKMERGRHTPITTTTTTTVTEKTSTNKFEALMEDSDDEHDTIQQQQFPSLPSSSSSSSSSSRQTAYTNTWATIAKASENIQQPIHKPVDNTYLDNYQYNCYYEDFSRTSNLTNYLSTSVQVEDDENESVLSDELTLEEKYGDRMYAMLQQYYREHTGKIVGILLQCCAEELEEFMDNNDYLQERADEALSLLQAQTQKSSRQEVEDW